MADAKDPSESPVNPHSEATVRNRSVPSQIQIPLVIFRFESEFFDAFDELRIIVNALSAS